MDGSGPTPATQRGLQAARAPAATELRALLALAAPLALVHIGNVMISAVDTAVVGRLGEIALGAVGLGTSLFFAVTVVGLGLMLGLDPLISQAIGAGERRHARELLWQSVWLSLLISVPLTLAILGVVALLPLTGVDPATARDTATYVLGRLPSLWPFLLAIGIRSYLQALGITRPLIVAIVAANVVNFALAWALVFGDAGLASVGIPPLGLPAFGIAGAAWAATISFLVITITLVVAVRGQIAEEEGAVRRRPDPATMRRAFVLGGPIGLQLLAEFGVFTITTVLVGVIGTRSLAAHQCAITLASATFQVSLAIGAATAVRVGRGVGQADVPATRRSGVVGLGSGAVLMLFTAVVLVSAPALLASILTDDAAVIAAAVPLIMIAGGFQLADGVQAVAAGALRGAGDTRIAMIANLAGHYGVGLPLGVALGFGLGWGAAGLWWGLSAGLASVALLLTLRFLRISARPIARA